jgi:hypothetical protein
MPDGAVTHAPPGTAQERLSLLATLADSVGAAALAADVSARAARLRAGRFFVACLGQFKRGKSTLLNALLGYELLPTGVIPVTSTVTVLRDGPSPPRALVHLADGRTREVPTIDLPAYVTEAGNPRNRKGVAAVEVFAPSPFLAHGLCLVDTPGLGSVFDDASRVTRTFVPHIDAALVVLGTDPPVSGEELDLIAEIGAQTQHLIFALNKADRVSVLDARAAADFTTHVVSQRLGRPVGPCLHVSATERLQRGRSRDWAALEQALQQLGTRGAEVVEEAATRAVHRLARRLVHDVHEQQAALVRPVEESERRLKDLHASVREADRAVRDLGALFTVEQVALAEALHEKQRAFLAGVRTTTAANLERVILQAPERRTPALRRHAMELARQTARHHVLLWRESIDPVGEVLYQQAMERFRALSNELLTQLGASAHPDAPLSSGIDADTGFTTESEFFFTELMSTADPPIPLWLLDRVWPRALALRSITRRARAYLDHLMATNTARVANDLEERVRLSALSLEAEIRSRLQEAVETATRALGRARERQAEGAQAAQVEVERLAALSRQVEQIATTLDTPVVGVQQVT